MTLPANIRQWPTEALEEFVERSSVIWADRGAVETPAAKRAADRDAERLVRAKYQSAQPGRHMPRVSPPARPTTPAAEPTGNQSITHRQPETTR